MTAEKKDHETKEEKPQEPSPLEQELTVAKKEAEEFKDKYLRALAEIENSRKRLTREKLESQSVAIQGVISEFLEPLDHFELALKHASALSPEMQVWSKGFEMLLQQFRQVLESNDVVPFEAVGKQFDPHLHEAIEVEENSTVPEGTVLHEFKKGYKMGARVVRPARVRVAGAPKEQKSENKEEKV